MSQLTDLAAPSLGSLRRPRQRQAGAGVGDGAPGGDDRQEGIVHDADLRATETMRNAGYPLELFLRVITLSLETVRIVHGLPKLEID